MPATPCSAALTRSDSIPFAPDCNEIRIDTLPSLRLSNSASISGASGPPASAAGVISGSVRAACTSVMKGSSRSALSGPPWVACASCTRKAAASGNTAWRRFWSARLGSSRAGLS